MKKVIALALVGFAFNVNANNFENVGDGVIGKLSYCAGYVTMVDSLMSQRGVNNPYFAKVVENTKNKLNGNSEMSSYYSFGESQAASGIQDNNTYKVKGTITDCANLPSAEPTQANVEQTEVQNGVEAVQSGKINYAGKADPSNWTPTSISDEIYNTAMDSTLLTCTDKRGKVATVVRFGSDRLMYARGTAGQSPDVQVAGYISSASMGNGTFEFGLGDTMYIVNDKLIRAYVKGKRVANIACV